MIRHAGGANEPNSPDAQSVAAGGIELRPHLEAYWLRPESALWDAIASAHIGEFLAGQDGLLELGIGNGYFSFLTLGGRLHPDFDWFRNVNVDGFWQGADIFDWHESGAATPASIVVRPALTDISIGVDHKPALLAQAQQLGFVKELLVHDCNQPLPPVSYRALYSNMLYWLDDPLSVLSAAGTGLPAGGRCVVAFPNSAFFDACTSYTSADPLWRMLNRNRASHILWHMDPDPFARAIEAAGVFIVVEIRRYLSPLTLKIWDVGLRPLSVPLIKMANALAPEARRSIKTEWCDTVERLAAPILEREEATASRDGGFTVAVLARKQ